MGVASAPSVEMVWSPNEIIGVSLAPVSFGVVRSIPASIDVVSGWPVLASVELPGLLEPQAEPKRETAPSPANTSAKSPNRSERRIFLAPAALSIYLAIYLATHLAVTGLPTGVEVQRKLSMLTAESRIPSCSSKTTKLNVNVSPAEMGA